MDMNEWETRFQYHVNEGNIEQAQDAWSRMMMQANKRLSATDYETRDRYLRGAYAISAEKSLTLINRAYSENLTFERKAMRASLVAEARAHARASGEQELIEKVEQATFTLYEQWSRQVQNKAEALINHAQTAYAHLEKKAFSVAHRSWFQKMQYCASRLFM
jgi:hypothetical protein